MDSKKGYRTMGKKKSIFDDYEEYRLYQDSFGDDNDNSGDYSGDGCLKTIFWGFIIIILVSLL